MKDGELSGEGTYRYASGDYFTGNYKNGKKNGFGRMLFANGDIY
jgi:hypothetical protein